jgi:hypothetical protein
MGLAALIQNDSGKGRKVSTDVLAEPARSSITYGCG